MPFTVPSFETIRDQYLNQVRNLQPGASTGADSDHYVRACAVAAVAEQLYAHQVWVWRQAFPDLADTDNMERMAAQRGVTRKTAAYASGSVRFVGEPGTTVPAGVVVSTTSMSYTTMAAVVVGGGGSVDATALADRTGSAGNVANVVGADVAGAPAGVASASVVAMAGGKDDEAASALLDRLLAVMSQPAQGGNANDYKVWALEVSGVRRAYVFPLRRGVGTVDVVPMPESGLPSAGLIAAVQTYIDARKPVGLGATGFMAIAPTALIVPITGTLQLESGYSLAQVLPLITSALNKLFVDLAPGETLYLTRVVATIVNVDGVADVTLVEPMANIVPTVTGFSVQIATLGTILLTLGV